MRQFKDNEGKNWDISINIGTIKRVRDLMGENLVELEAGEPPLLTRLGTDVILLCDIIYCICQNQAQERNITDEDFGLALGGDAIIRAQNAFYEELVDFFRLSGRTDRAKAIAAQNKMISLTIQKLDSMVEGLSVETKVDEIFSEQSTSSRD